MSYVQDEKNVIPLDLIREIESLMSRLPVMNDEIFNSDLASVFYLVHIVIKLRS